MYKKMEVKPMEMHQLNAKIPKKCWKKLRRLQEDGLFKTLAEGVEHAINKLWEHYRGEEEE